MAPLASRSLAALPAGRPVGHGSQPVRLWPQSGPASVSLLTPAALGVLKVRRDGLLSEMGLPWFTLPSAAWQVPLSTRSGMVSLMFNLRISTCALT